MRSCFYQADSLGLRSIAFPLLGCGLGGFSKSICLDLMFRFVARAFLRGITSIEDVTIAFLRPGEATDEWYQRLQGR
jgi:O-acetyl-ADP-ribose deacetylase (regulator of RNase III)